MPGSYDPYDFANRRHIGPSASEISEMLTVVGAPNLHALIDETVPANICASISESHFPSVARSTSSERRLTRTVC